MESVCAQVPTILPGDLESVGYHRKCYMSFTKNLHRLRDDTEPEPSTSQRHHSPRKPGGSAGYVFPPECIFCETVEIKDEKDEVHLTNLETTHPGAKDLLSMGAIAVARSMIPGALSAVDKTMEETFMFFAKSSGGFAGLYSQFGAYQRWCRTTSTLLSFMRRPSSWWTSSMIQTAQEQDDIGS